MVPNRVAPAFGVRLPDTPQLAPEGASPQKGPANAWSEVRPEGPRSAYGPYRPGQVRPASRQPHDPVKGMNSATYAVDAQKEKPKKEKLAVTKRD
jgi:hypothetical protein